MAALTVFMRGAMMPELLIDRLGRSRFFLAPARDLLAPARGESQLGTSGTLASSFCGSREAEGGAGRVAA